MPSPIGRSLTRLRAFREKRTGRSGRAGSSSEALSCAVMSNAPQRLGRVVYVNGAIQFATRGAERRVFSDLYHHLLRTTWPRLFLILLGAYASINAVFALLYYVGGDCVHNARPGSLLDDYWFSVQTLATIGYGEFAPSTTYAHVVVAFEAFLGMISVALGTGLMFAKFSRPRARVAFSKNAVINLRNGARGLQLRIANERSSTIAEARVTISALCDEMVDGAPMRRFRQLRLERAESPVFALSWSVFHPIDEHSPLHGLGPKELEQHIAALVVTFSGIDETQMQSVHARHAYTPKEILFDHRFVDMMGTSDDGLVLIDHSRLHGVVPVE